MPSLPFRTLVTAAALALALGATSLPSASASSAAAAASGRSTGFLAAVRTAAAPVAEVATTWAAQRHAAEAALARAQAGLAGGARAAAFSPGAHGHDAAARPDLTLTLRDLRAGLPYLARQDRAAAQRVLARPSLSGRQRTCDDHVCIQWTKSAGSDDAVPSTDTGPSGPNRIPDQVDLTLAVMSEVYDRIVTTGGYRKPLRDGTRGGDARLDVYLANLGEVGLFGYCVPDGDGPGRTSPGYCALDNDYAPSEYGTSQTPENNLKVTAAHEFFHAVQFAYDMGEDDWFMEGTAMWMEDEVYDDVNDNVRYLGGSQLTSPTRSLDRAAPGTGGPYVSWIFWRWVTEQFPDQGSSGLPLIMRGVWQRAQAYDPDRPRTYSMRALNLALAARDASLTNVFARFGEANRHPADAYAEGLEQSYPRVPPVATYSLSTSTRSVSEKVATMAHMTNYTIVFRPDASLGGADWRLRVPVNAPDRARGSRAQLSVVRTDGTRTRSFVSLDRRGNGVARAPFRAGTIARVELTVTNAGQRYRCNQGTRLSCRGTSRDDGLKTYFKASISRS